MQKNDIFEIEITDMGVNGEGIGHYQGMTFFIKDALIGDVIDARVTKLKKNYGYARVEAIKSPSTFRIEPKCELHRRCGEYSYWKRTRLAILTIVDNVRKRHCPILTWHCPSDAR